MHKRLQIDPIFNTYEVPAQWIHVLSTRGQSNIIIKHPELPNADSFLSSCFSWRS